MPQTFADQINGNPLYAARAVADEDGVSLKQYYAKIADLAAVAFSGSYNDLANTPLIPTKTSDLTNDSGFITASDIPAQVNADWNEIDPSDPAYIKNKPTIPVVPTTDQTYDASSSNPQSGTAVAGAIAGVNQVPASTSSDKGKVLTVDSLGIPSWAAVPQQSTGLFEAVYGTTAYADIVQAIADKKIVYCHVSSTNPSRMAFLAYIGRLNGTGKIEFQYYRSNANGNDSVFVYEVDASSNWTTTERPAGIKTQVKSDWNANSGAAQILNKPDLSVYKEIVYITPSNDAEADATAIATALNAGKFVIIKDTYSATSLELLISGYITGSYYNFSSWSDSRYVCYKVLSYTNDAWSWSTVTKKTIMPNYGSSQAGKLLTVNSAGSDLEWGDAPSDGKEYIRKNGAWNTSKYNETVLMNTAVDIYSAGSLTLSEVATNFERVKVLYRNNDGYVGSVEFDPTVSFKLQFLTFTPLANGNTYLKGATMDSSDGLTFTLVAGPSQFRYKSSDGSGTSYTAAGSNIFVYKVIGVNRIASN